jgi:predicted GNAT family acetyltransferase
MGLGGRLARAALDDARARRLVVVPYCPFIAAYIERHLDEYGDLVAPEMLSGDRL